jgi:magnesium chelatase subunit I
MRPTTLGALKRSGHTPRSVKEEVRANLIRTLGGGGTSFPGILGYEESVIPDTERALLSRHNILFLGLRGQAKTRMARQMVDLLDEYIPVVEGSEVNDDPLHPISAYARERIEREGDDTPVAWLHRSARYGEKLATPDVSVADLIGDIDPVKAANLRLSFADERVIHYGIIPRSNRGIFVINELPDLQARIQVALFNILQEGDVQIRGFRLRMPLDILFVFTANPEDYTNRGTIVTPLKDRIESQILTHYPKTVETALAITEQEAHLHPDQRGRVQAHGLIRRIIEQVSFEARGSEYVDQKSGVSARLTISAYENAVSAAERRAILNGEAHTQVWVGDLAGILPSVTGKIELVYEGEQEGPLQVSLNLLEKAVRSVFSLHFPGPESFKKRKGRENAAAENPYRAIIGWFDAGNRLDMPFRMTDADRALALYRVDGLHALARKTFPEAGEAETLLWMEFVLHGLASHSLISRRLSDDRFAFNDLMGAMLDMGSSNTDEEEE